MVTRSQCCGKCCRRQIKKGANIYTYSIILNLFEEGLWARKVDLLAQARTLDFQRSSLWYDHRSCSTDLSTKRDADANAGVESVPYLGGSLKTVRGYGRPQRQGQRTEGKEVNTYFTAFRRGQYRLECNMLNTT